MEAKNMNFKKLNILVLLISSLIFLGCSKSGSSNKRLNRSGRGVGNTQIGPDGRPIGNIQGFAQSCSGVTGSFSGQVYYSQGFQNDFDYAVSAMLTALGDPSYDLQYGGVDSNCGGQSGLFFDGQVGLDQHFDMNGQNFSYVNQSARLNMAVVDTTALQTQQAIEIYGNSANGYVDGNQAMIEFYWDGGVIIFEGQIDYNNQIFQGDISFENNVHYAGSAPAVGYLGYFDIPMCDFFACN